LQNPTSDPGVESNFLVGLLLCEFALFLSAHVWTWRQLAWQLYGTVHSI